MSEATNIAIADGEDTPVTHTFEPVRSSGESFFWENGALASTSPGFETLELKLTPQKGNAKTDRVTAKITVPVEQTVDGIVSVHHFNQIEIISNTHTSATQQEKENLRILAYNLLANGTLTEYIEERKPAF
jgi:hypothetical protein